MATGDEAEHKAKIRVPVFAVRMCLNTQSFSFDKFEVTSSMWGGTARKFFWVLHLDRQKVARKKE